MVEASRGYVDVFDLQRRAGDRLARLTGNEAAYVANGATGGLFLATLACMTGCDQRAISRLPSLEGLRDEVIVHRTHRMPLDLAVLLAGATFVEIGNRLVTSVGDLEAAIGERTAAVLYMAGDFYRVGALSLEETVDIAHAHELPVVVDAAEQVPPSENLWRCTRELGADLAVFSGGKGICGPQASGLVVGRRDLVEACYQNGYPHTRLGRALKVGKEEIVGLLAAVELCLSDDYPARVAAWNAVVDAWERALGDLPGVSVQQVFPTWSPSVARLLLEVGPGNGFTAQDLCDGLLRGDPAVAVEIPPNTSQVFANPEPLEPGEESVVVDRIREVVLALRP